MIISEITHVFFDLGETPFAPLDETIGIANLLDTSRRASIHLPDETIIRTHQTARHVVAQRFREFDFYYHREFVKEVLECTFRNLRSGDVGEFAEMYCELQHSAVVNSLEPREDCLSALKTIKLSGYVIAIVSNIDNDWIDPLITKWQLNSHAQLILSSETAYSCKPHAKIFLDACNALNCEPAQVLFVGDSEENDVSGARRLGMKTARFDSTGISTTKADMSIRSLSQLLTCLR